MIGGLHARVAEPEAAVAELRRRLGLDCGVASAISTSPGMHAMARAAKRDASPAGGVRDEAVSDGEGRARLPGETSVP